MKKLYTIGYFAFVAIVVFIALILLGGILPIPESSYKVGDIITFGKDTKTEVPTTHRIIGDKVIDGVLIYTTKGDANEDKDTKEVRKDEIIGKTIFSVPYLGYIMDFAKKPLGFILLVGLPALYIVYDEVAKIVAEVKKLRKKNESNIEENV